MGLWEEQPSSLFSLKGLELCDESPLLFKWEWISDPLDCPPNETCKPEPMAGTTIPLGGNPRPFQGGEEVRDSVSAESEFNAWILDFTRRCRVELSPLSVGIHQGLVGVLLTPEQPA
ncbi:hypothetical protein HS1genome_1177 [Sulfodiicoccus acidiphilus]|uniref:Uncharacterized protein n=1 Tax=Sulfodiicoccus acidiphilus TaxID=1670455 RepID=A0A348B3N6_9CREN|nr:hypothetical protein HS1genome_1177 [Sulfodiicoccus acidiphilus]GGT99816.1 hypothetical protein GCM10007116_16500 [Sulfodiicoccus acidiphilus]